MAIYLCKETMKQWNNQSPLFVWLSRWAQMLHQKMEIYFWVPLSKFLSSAFHDAESQLRNA
jgi:hypothetical protein